MNAVVYCALAVAFAAAAIWHHTATRREQEAAANRRMRTAARIEALRLAELEAMWQTPTHTNRRR